MTRISSGLSNVTSKATAGFPDPFADMASLAMPDNIRNALYWCEFIIMANGPYREAFRRIISYFITDIEITSINPDKRVGREEKQKYEEYFNDTLRIKEILADVALDFLTYGNAFSSVIVPFRRYLSCKRCGFESPFQVVSNNSKFSFSWQNYEFKAQCPKCNYNGPWRRIDRRATDGAGINIKRWSVHEMDIMWDPITSESAFIWRIPGDYKKLIDSGNPFHLERASAEILNAIKENKYLQFNKGVIHHMKESTLCGIRSRGWGISKVLTNFRQAWYLQVLQRYNEAIALDYIIPFRLLTPAPRSGAAEGGDPLLSLDLGKRFVPQVMNMLKKRRKDPTSWNILPFPVEYQALGGEASQLAPKDLLDQGLITLLNSIGIPAELFQGSISVQTAPAALRLFEANWIGLINNLNNFLSFIVDKISKLLSWEPVVARLTRVTHADDLNRQMAKLQLMMGGQISKTTGLSSVGLDYTEEVNRQLDEERLIAEETQNQQEDLEQAAQMDLMAQPQDPMAMAGGMGGMPMPGGMPPAGGAMPPDAQQQMMPQFQGMAGAMPGGGMPPVSPMAGGAPMAAQQFAANMGTMPTDTPEALMAKAETLAQQIVIMPATQRRSTLVQLKSEDPTLHALVSSILEDIDRQAKQEGGALVKNQQFGTPIA